MNNPFCYTPSPECIEAYRRLLARIEDLKRSREPDDVRFVHELEEGKMLGVLIAADGKGARHSLYAFSGQIGDSGFHYDGFVGPVFDYLDPDGYFKKKEAEISGMNLEIARFERSGFAKAKKAYDEAVATSGVRISEYKEKIRLSKMQRDARRKSGDANEAELAAMVRCSQFEKAELQRLKRKLRAEIEPIEEALKEARSHLCAMKEKRRSESEALQQWLFSNFTLIDALGEKATLSDVFAETPVGIPPSGAGECCAPKLLHAAYVRGWLPVSIAEFWYGKSKDGEVRIHGSHYPACRGKCLPVLGWMLRGLQVEPPLDVEINPTDAFEPEIVFENQWFCVIDKPGGMLSVPGKGSAVSAEDWLKERYGPERFVKMVHRLDRDTSGLLVAAFTPQAFKAMQALFATRGVKKTYVAELEGDYVLRGVPESGCIRMPLSPDWLDRPRQRVDFEKGKTAETEYEFVRVSEGRSRIMFRPRTGRTHQLRVHAASGHGLGMPIAGDPLYGVNAGDAPARLLLHAHRLEFTFPVDNVLYSFESPVPF